MFDEIWFFDLEKRLRAMGLDSDEKSFDEIKENLLHPKKLSPDEFASAAIYVVLASGFSQKTAKIIHGKIMEYFKSVIPRLDRGTQVNNLLKIFNNKNKINAAIKIWENREIYRSNYYKITDSAGKLNFLGKMPHIGQITRNHLARNLGENVFKRDVWIDRLLNKYGEDLLENLAKETNLPIGYIDVVLWKAAQNGLIKLSKRTV